MNYNTNFIKEKKINETRIIYKKNSSTLKNKIDELKNKLDFCNKNSLSNIVDNNLDDSIKLLDKIIEKINKDIIKNAQIVNRNKNIEYEF